MRKNLTILLFLFNYIAGYAQVTVGSAIAPNPLALLDLKDQQQAGTVGAVSDNNNITSTTGGLMLPRVQLVTTTSLMPFISDTAPAATAEFKLRLAGLMVYNITNNGVGSALYPAIYVWSGNSWTTSQANEAVSSITSQPQAFTFYEQGTETPDALSFVVDGEGNWSYQWYQVTGSNVHVRVGTPIGQLGTINGTGATTTNFIPTGALKGTTRNANNTGFYKFYCIAQSTLGAKLESATVEVAVGCGAKDKDGEWMSFMCFNLGADIDMTINKQMTTTMATYSYDPSTGLHTYAAGEEKVWGDLYQWGRIADGHEKRSANGTTLKPSVAKGALADANIVTGNRCSTSESIGRPHLQIAKAATTWHGQFIHGAADWHPNTAQSALDGLWRNGRFVQNDPCAHFNANGTMSEFWHEGTDLQNNSPACSDAGTAWRTPQQEEWGGIYKGGGISGSSANATANTWRWHMPQNGTSNLTQARGYKIQPDGVTTTLFLPASGNQRLSNGLLYSQGAYGYYWSSSVLGTDAYSLYFGSDNVYPARSNARASGFTLRCIKSN